jgi:hypothetical protein
MASESGRWRLSDRDVGWFQRMARQASSLHAGATFWVRWRWYVVELHYAERSTCVHRGAHGLLRMLFSDSVVVRLRVGVV